MSKKQNIVLVEHSPVIRAGMRSLLEHLPEVARIWDLVDSEHLHEYLLRYTPDILIINPVLMEYPKRGNFRNLFSDFPDMQLIALVYQAQPSSWLKPFHAIIELYDDEQQIQRKLQDVIRNKSLSCEENNSGNYELTERETDVLVALAKGLSNKEIAEKLTISINTVISHRKNIVRKTNIKSVAGLTVYAMLNNLID